MVPGGPDREVGPSRRIGGGGPGTDRERRGASRKVRKELLFRRFRLSSHRSFGKLTAQTTCPILLMADDRSSRLEARIHS